MKRTELDKVVTRLEKRLKAAQADIASLQQGLDESRADLATLEKAAAQAQSDVREAQRMAREGGFGIESLLAAELELKQQIDAITGDGL